MAVEDADKPRPSFQVGKLTLQKDGTYLEQIASADWLDSLLPGLRPPLPGFIAAKVQISNPSKEPIATHSTQPAPPADIHEAWENQGIKKIPDTALAVYIHGSAPRLPEIPFKSISGFKRLLISLKLAGWIIAKSLSEATTQSGIY